MYEATGTIKRIFDTQTFPSGFSKREFVLTTHDRYPQDLKFEVLKDKCSMLDQFAPNQEVVVNFDIRGNEYQGKYFVNLSCWKIQAAGIGGGTGSAMADGEDDFGSPAPSPGRGQGPRSNSGAKSGGGAGWRQPPVAEATLDEEPSMEDLRDENDFDDDIPF